MNHLAIRYQHFNFSPVARMSLNPYGYRGDRPSEKQKPMRLTGHDDFLWKIDWRELINIAPVALIQNKTNHLITNSKVSILTCLNRYADQQNTSTK